MEIQKINPVKQEQKLLDFVSIIFLVKETFIEYFIKLHCKIYKCFLIYILNNSHKKGQKPQILLPGIIDYNFVTSTKYEGKFTEYLRHIMVKARGKFEHQLDIYMLI